MIQHILLDQDGILANFFNAALEVHGREDLAGEWPKGVWAMETVMGLTPAEFWEPLDHYGFWRETVCPYPRIVWFYQELSRRLPVVICTSPSENSQCAAAKIDWLRHYLGKDVKYMIGAQKHLMARPSNLLIDDSDKNVGMFRAAGGTAILFPCVWNSQHAVTEDPYEYVIQRVDALLATPAQ